MNDRSIFAARRWLLALALAALGGCKGNPRWSTQVSGLDRIVLSLWGQRPDDVWAVGGTCDGVAGCATTGRALVLHFDGGKWTEVQTGAHAVLWWVFGFGPKDVWAAGSGGTILHYDGTMFTAVPSGAAPGDVLYGIWGPAPGDLWAVGGNPDQSSTVLRYANGAFAPAPGAPMIASGARSGAYFKVWGSAANDVYFVGQLGAMVHFDGAAYRRVDLAAAGVTDRDGLFTAAGRGRDDVYVVGGQPAKGLALHFDGATWAPVAGLNLSQTQQLFGVKEDAGGDVAIVGAAGAKFVGAASAWRDDSMVPPGADFHAAWLFAADDVFAVGGNFFTLNGGTIAHYGSP